METGTNTEEQAPGKGRDSHRVLLIADEVFSGSDLAKELEGHLDVEKDEVEVLVISPALAHTTIDQELGNVDPVLPETGERMVEVVDELNRAGFSARGQVGDLDPMMAIGDGLAQFDAEEIVVVANDDENAEPGEEGLWERIEGEFHQPLTMIKVAPVPESEVPEIVSSQHAPARDKTDEEIVRETRNVPPFSRRDLLGILFGVIGTIALGWIAVLAASDDPRGSLSAASAAILLIAIGAFLINVAHVVGLVFFESVRYKGIWEKFMARMSIIVTSFGLVIALALLLLDEI
ncbi:MAG: hypothetical protein KDB39_06975 [Austwickia sp.]|jgi:hypothetical protein|nr:hypothetical protein [Solirubrobacterales bacterium]MCB1252974.1 hypothetical protein [Austwickia sp.]